MLYQMYPKQAPLFWIWCLYMHKSNSGQTNKLTNKHPTNKLQNLISTVINPTQLSSQAQASTKGLEWVGQIRKCVSQHCNSTTPNASMKGQACKMCHFGLVMLRRRGPWIQYKTFKCIPFSVGSGNQCNSGKKDKNKRVEKNVVRSIIIKEKKILS